MTIDVDLSAEIPAMEFGHQCIGDCADIAEWTVWLSHTDGCTEGNLFMCGAHRDLCEQAWIMLLAIIPGPCQECGVFIYAGNLADHFRAMRL